jgi:RNA polymerase sigma-70 factor (ECF subfamily)
LAISDEELLPRLRRGDGEAFRLLVDRYGDDLFRLGRSVMDNEADGYDLVQQTLLGAYQRIGAFDGRSSLRTWLLRILFNQASKMRRSQRVRRAIPLHAAEASGGMETGGQPGGGGGGGAGSPVDAALRREAATDAVEARMDATQMLDALSEDHRQVLVLRELQRMSYEEIAAVLNVPIGTVESRLYRARRELQKRFPDYL